MDYKDDLGSQIKLTVEGMRFQIVEVLQRRNMKLIKAVEEYVSGSELIKDITKQIDSEIKYSLNSIINDVLEKTVEKEVSNNKTIKEAIIKSIVNNKTAIAGAIYQKILKD